MISLDQVLLLEEKVESAVAKIAQLNAENAALRSKCAELTNALSAKTEQFSSFQSDQSKIEEGILKALERLNTVENAVHAAAAKSAAAVTPSPVQEAPAPVAEPKPQQVIPEPSFENISNTSFDTAAPVQESTPQQSSYTAPQQPVQDTITPQLDIF